MFFDEVSLTLEGGHGGSGAVSFHREKFIAYGPPDGGNGGNGGSVVLCVNENLNTFRHFSGQKHFKAEKGVDGHKNNMTGRTGEDLVIEVPMGTLVYDAKTNEVLADLNEPNGTCTAAYGGRGGYGNANFTSSTRQAPKFAELGDIGEICEVRMELQLVADVGLVGFPSAGKSTLISHVSSAKPKIANYPFTTLVPNLGVVYLSQFGASQDQNFVIADMPGIIEGASEGKGLGDAFLKHISRTAILVFLLDPFSYDDRDMAEQYKILQSEIEKYKPELLNKSIHVVMNKIDAIPEEDREELKVEFIKKYPDLKSKFWMVSGVSGEGLHDFMFDLWNTIESIEEEVPDIDEFEETPDYEPISFVDEQSFDVIKLYDFKIESFEFCIWGQRIQNESMPERQLFKVTGKRVEQISRMSNLEQEGSLERIYDVLQKMDIQKEISKQGGVTGDIFKLGPHFFEFHDL